MIAQSPIKQWHPLDQHAQPAPEPTERQQARRRAYAKLLCRNASNSASWALADKMAARFGCEGCAALGVSAPKDVAQSASQKR